MRKLVAIVIILFGVSILYVIDHWQVIHWRNEKKIELNAMLNLYQTHLKNTITSRFSAIESLASLFILHPQTTPSEFSEFAAFLLELNPPIRAIQFADSDTRVTYVYPPTGNEITIKKPMKLISDPKRGPFVIKAINEKQSILQGPFELRQGGTGVAVRFPIFKDNKLIGLSIGVYDIDVLAREALSNLNFTQVAFSLKDAQGKIFWNSEKLSDDFLYKELKVAGATWTVSASWLDTPVTPFFYRLLIISMGVSLLLIVLAYFQKIWKQERQLKKEVEERTHDLSTSNQNLLKEIAERKQVEIALRDSEEYLRAIYEAAENVAFIITDLAGEETRILDLSLGAEKIFGYARNEIIGEKVAVLHPPDVVKEFPEMQARLKENRPGYSGEAVLVRKNGEAFSALFTIFPKTDNTGNLIGTIGVSIDISKRKIVENALRDSENKFSKTFQCAPLLMTISTIKDGMYIDVNEAFERVTGYTRDVAVGSTSIDLGYIRKEDRERIALELKSKGRVRDLELELTCADGTQIECLYSGELIEVNGKQRLLSIASDITERKKIEERLRQAQKMESIGNLAGGIAHDFNNLLFPIIGMSELLLEDLPKENPGYENVREILNAGRRAGDLVKQILAFSRQSEHKMVPVRIQNILKEVLKLSHSTIPSNIKIHENIQKDCEQILGDGTQIHQVAMNLITNAFHAIEEKNGTIEVVLKEIFLEENGFYGSSLKAGQYIRLAISDNGSGMDQNTINKIFEPYFTTKKQGKGTGLGLAVVYGIIKEHGGEINVYSEVGKGSTFNIYLPVIQKTEGIAPVEENMRIETGNEKILLIDDEVSVANLSGKILSRLGYQVTLENSSVKALNMFKLNPEIYDLVISDMTMPDMTGDQLAREMLSVKPDIPIIISTGFSERINKERAESLGVKGFLMKPFSKYDLSHMVRTVLGESKTQ